MFLVLCFDASKLLEEKILKFNTEEKTGLNLNENFAKFINSLLANQMAPTKRNDLYDKYLRPGNCNLNYPTVNDVIWDNSFGCFLDVKLHTNYYPAMSFERPHPSCEFSKSVA